MKRIESGRYYDDEYDNDEYTSVQVERHRIKKDKRADKSMYQRCGVMFKQHNVTGSLLCLGTRNNWERDRLGEFSDMDAKSMDIASDSSADYIGDFNELSGTWTDMWDAVYSNALDHAPDPTTTFHEWLRVVKPGGVLMLGVEYIVHTGPADCSYFDENTVEEFLEDFDVVDRFKTGKVHHFMVKKMTK